MEIVPFAGPTACALVELGGAGSMSMATMIDSQREIFHSQVEQLHNIVVTQCRLTGVNPLAQEMAAGALSIKIGKKPRDLLNPKAVKYMQSIFSIKDTIGKRETREISAICGVTLTQVREFFNSQRAKVKKIVHVSDEKAKKLETSRLINVPQSLESRTPCNIMPFSVVNESQTVGVVGKIPDNYCLTAGTDGELSTVVKINMPEKSENSQASNIQQGSISGVDSEDKKILDNIIALMKKEETFSGQVKLMEWILHVKETSVLQWFVTVGGLGTLATWLNDAALDEQTSVLHVIFKVLSHLPLHAACPDEVSSIVLTVNKLRFYRSADISNRAKDILRRWGKILARKQFSQKAYTSRDAHKERICKERICEILSTELWRSEKQISGNLLSLPENTADRGVSEQPEGAKVLRLLPASSDDSVKRNGSGISPLNTKTRRKVLLVEHPDNKFHGKNMEIARKVSTTRSRPLSADDIQKAKKRAFFMQSKHGTVGTTKSDDKLQRTESHNVSLQNFSTSPPIMTQKDVRNVGAQGSSTATISNSSIKIEPTLHEANVPIHLLLEDKLKASQCHWVVPPEVRLDPSWMVVAGDGSKEIAIQSQRIQREKETSYASQQDIPPDPKEPWDMEMDFDDSLTLEIPTYQPPDPNDIDDAANRVSGVTSGPILTPAALDDSMAPSTSNGASGTDMELLDVLLKNPDLVFTLTSGQAQTLPSEDVVALLDLLKKSSAVSQDLVDGLANGSVENQAEMEPFSEAIPTSLPSPTPPSESARVNKWRSEFPVTTRASTLNPGVGVATVYHTTMQHTQSTINQSLYGTERYSSTVFLPTTDPVTGLSLPHPTVSVNPPQRHVFPNNAHAPRETLNSGVVYDAVMHPQFSTTHGVSPASGLSIFPISHPVASNSYVASSEPMAFMPTRWQSAASNVHGSQHCDITPELWTDQRSNAVGVSYTNSRHFANQSSFDAYAAGSRPQEPFSLSPENYGSGGNVSDLASQSIMEEPMLPARYSSVWSYGENKVESSQDYKLEESRQWASRHRENGNYYDTYGNQNVPWARDGDSEKGGWRR